MRAHTLPEPCPEPPPPSRYRPGGIIEGSRRLQYRGMPPANQLQDAFARFGALNATDPNGKELLYAQRMMQWLDKLAPGASEPVRLAARGQHLMRWRIPRDSYP